MLSNRFIRAASFALLSCVSLVASAFMPGAGAWNIVAESTTSAPGRGMTIEVENDILILTYYGYRADGSSLFYIAAGPMSGNTFTAPLSDYKNGTPIGQTYRPAVSTGSSPGNVVINFSNGLRGTMTLPGETAKTISKYEFGYGNLPSGLFGSYLFAYTTNVGSTFTNTFDLTIDTGQKTSNGSGAVTDFSWQMICENQVSGPLAGVVTCAETGSTSYENQYTFKMSGDRGTGVGTWTSNPSYYPAQIIRTATKTGKLTGINDGTMSSVAISSMPSPSILATRRLAQQTQNETFNYLKDREPPASSQGVRLSPEEQQALQQWSLETKLILNK